MLFLFLFMYIRTVSYSGKNCQFLRRLKTLDIFTLLLLYSVQCSCNVPTPHLFFSRPLFICKFIFIASSHNTKQSISLYVLRSPIKVALNIVQHSQHMVHIWNWRFVNWSLLSQLKLNYHYTVGTFFVRYRNSSYHVKSLHTQPYTR